MLLLHCARWGAITLVVATRAATVALKGNHEALLENFPASNKSREGSREQSTTTLGCAAWLIGLGYM